MNGADDHSYTIIPTLFEQLQIMYWHAIHMYVPYLLNAN